MSKNIINSDIFKEPVVSNHKKSFLERIFRKIESSSFQPIQIGSESSLANVVELILKENESGFFSKDVGLECLHVREAQADLMIVHGYISKKLEPYILDCYNKMGKPTYIIRIKNSLWESNISDQYQSRLFDEYLHPDIEIEREELSTQLLQEKINELRTKIRNG